MANRIGKRILSGVTAFFVFFFLVGKFECNLLTHVCLANAKRQRKVLTYCRFLQTRRPP